jgi:hypothetical protein
VTYPTYPAPRQAEAKRLPARAPIYTRITSFGLRPDCDARVSVGLLSSALVPVVAMSQKPTARCSGLPAVAAELEVVKRPLFEPFYFRFCRGFLA